MLNVGEGAHSVDMLTLMWLSVFYCGSETIEIMSEIQSNILPSEALALHHFASLLSIDYSILGH
jgi:hypothetical protein